MKSKKSDNSNSTKPSYAPREVKEEFLRIMPVGGRMDQLLVLYNVRPAG